MEMQITKIHADASLPEYKTKGAVAFDLAASKTVTVSPKSFEKIPTGLVAKVPEGYMLMICARSSSVPKRGLTLPHGVGIIDQDYCGPTDELLILISNLTDAPVTIEKGERIAQGVVVKIEQCTIVESAITTDQSRGGFGSTGQK